MYNPASGLSLVQSISHPLAIEKFPNYISDHITLISQNLSGPKVVVSRLWDVINQYLPLLNIGLITLIELISLILYCNFASMEVLSSGRQVVVEAGVQSAKVADLTEKGRVAGSVQGLKSGGPAHRGRRGIG